MKFGQEIMWYVLYLHYLFAKHYETGEYLKKILEQNRGNPEEDLIWCDVKWLSIIIYYCSYTYYLRSPIVHIDNLYELQILK